MKGKDIRKGDVVRLKPVTIAAIGDLDFLPEESCREGYIELDMVEEIISRAETDAEKIENLERDKAFWKASAESYMNTIIELQDKLISAEEVAEMKPHSVKLDDPVAPGKMTMIDASGKPKWTVCFKPKPAAGPDTPAQLEGYGPWIKSTDIPPETNMYGWMCYVVNFGNLYYCKKLED